MKIDNPQRIYAYFAAFLFLSACKMPGKDNASSAKSHERYHEVGIAKFLKGFEEGASEQDRQESGKLLRSKYENALQDMHIDPKRPEKYSKQQQISLKFFQWSVERTEKSSDCSADQKLRVYRGARGLPMLQTRTGSMDRAMVLFGAWNKHLHKELESQIESGTISRKKPRNLALREASVQFEGDQSGWLIMEHASRFSPQAFEEFDLPFYLGKGRLGWLSLGFIGMDMAKILNDHKLESKNSPLISTATGSVAANFGPPYFYLDICPERLIFGKYFESERELLVPLLLLPEEFHKIDKWQCSELESAEYPRECVSYHLRDPEQDTKATVVSKFFSHCRALHGDDDALEKQVLQQLEKAVHDSKSKEEYRAKFMHIVQNLNALPQCRPIQPPKY